MTFEEKTLETQRIYEGKIINLRRDKVTVENGTSYREIVEHNGGAVLAAVTDDGKMVMVRQYRKPAERVMLEVPAGKIDKGETPLETAARELKEETGYTPSNVEYLTEFYPSVGYSEEVLYLYLCTGLTAGETCPDENEALDVLTMDVEELYRMVMNAEICDAKTIVAILMVKSLFEEGKLPAGRKE
ncbi:MAG: NUDIX hydrolase [Firmicutes bacterium]|nr:NUDIX hydrolase [Bacillota bacterium]